MVFDISPLISERLQVWPGDTPVRREVLYDMDRGDHLTLSTLNATVHLGAHADAPSHYCRGAAAIQDRSLDYYLGPCQVIRPSARAADSIGPESIRVSIAAPRVLLATDTFPDPEYFQRNFAYLSPDLVDWLHDRGVILVGVDTPSVDRFDAIELLVHHRFLKHDMAILEGLVLRDVPEGLYELIALPLKLAGFDASPVRAILRSLPANEPAHAN
jgi:arylformamidase